MKAQRIIEFAFALAFLSLLVGACSPKPQVPTELGGAAEAKVAQKSSQATASPQIEDTDSDFIRKALENGAKVPGTAVCERTVNVIFTVDVFYGQDRNSFTGTFTLEGRNPSAVTGRIKADSITFEEEPGPHQCDFQLSLKRDERKLAGTVECGRTVISPPEVKCDVSLSLPE